MKRVIKFAAVVAVVAFAATSCKEAEVVAPPTPAYTMMEVTSGDCDIKRDISATIRGEQDIEIYPQVSGTITRIAVQEGDKVKKGELMFVIDQVPYKAAVATAKANVATAKSQLSTAELTMNSKRKLFDASVISEYDYAMAVNSRDVALANLAQTEAALINANNDLSYTEIRSPATGDIGTIPYRVGALVNILLQEPLTTVSNNAEMQVYFSIPENDLLSLIRKHGSREGAVKSMPEVELRLSDGSIYEHKGRINTLSGVINPNTGSITLRADYSNKEGLLHSGASGNVIVPSQMKGVHVIPQEATYEIQDKVFVYKYGADSLAKGQMIEVMRTNDAKSYVVTDGLNDGDVIVTEGVGLLREGTKILRKADAKK